MRHADDRSTDLPVALAGDLDGLADDLAGAGDFSRRGLHRPWLAELACEIPPAQLRHLASLVFVLLKPDAVAAGKVPAALDLLERRGFSIVELAVCHRTSARQFEELYKYNQAKYAAEDRPASWWLNSQVYALGPVVTLLVRGPHPAHATYAAVGALKGPSDPCRGAPGQLRFELGACNRAINLVHTSDDAASTAREYLLFHPRRRLAALLAREPAAAAPWRERFPLAGLASVGGRAARAIDFVSSLVALKLMLHELEAEAGADTRGAAPAPGGDPIVPIYRALVELADQQGLPPRLRLERYRALCHQERAVRAAAPPSSPSCWSEALRQLADFEAYRVEVAQRVLALLRGEGVRVDPWDQLILETGMYYLDDFRSLAASAPR